MDNNKLETISNLFEDSEIRSAWYSERKNIILGEIQILIKRNIRR